MPAQTPQELLQQLLTQDLSGVTFVRDYLQLQFDPPPILNVYSRCRLVTTQGKAEFGESDFANRLIGEIGKHIVGVSEVPDEYIAITLEDAARIEIPIAKGSFSARQAYIFFGKDMQYGVWPNK